MAADTSSAPAATIWIVGTAARTFAALSADSMSAKSAAADCMSSGAAMR
ncbi:hypothetical protein TM48_05360 [Mycobacterium shottsii]|nr:hypothetical protein TM48_05360 [Mycobacterium shottsii]